MNTNSGAKNTCSCINVHSGIIYIFATKISLLVSGLCSSHIAPFILILILISLRCTLPYRHRIHILGLMQHAFLIHSVLPKDWLSDSVYNLMTVWYISLIYSIVSSQQMVRLPPTALVWEEFVPLFIFSHVGIHYKYQFHLHCWGQHCVCSSLFHMTWCPLESDLIFTT